MERIIKFRGKNTTTGKWLYGSLLTWLDGCCKIYDKQLSDGSMAGLEVEPLSVGQFTGFVDKHGKEIYEGDIFHLGDPNIRYVVVYRDCGLIGRQIGSSSTVGIPYWSDSITIIGNLYETVP